MPEILTFTSCSTCCACDCKYFWRYEKRIKPKVMVDSEALVQGNVGHVGCDAYVKNGLEAGLKAVDKWQREHPGLGAMVDAQMKRALIARGMLRAIAERWPIDQDVERRSEFLVSMPVSNPDTTGKSRSFTFTGVVDGLVATKMFDWKFITDAAKTIRERVIGYQTECYAAAAMDAGIEITDSEFRMGVKPAGGTKIRKNETPVEFEDRIYEDTRDKDRLHEHVVYVNPARILRAREWLWDVSKRILENRAANRWLPNAWACHDWQRTCEYAPLCECDANGGDVEWLVEDLYRPCAAHPELERCATEKGGGTNESIVCSLMARR